MVSRTWFEQESYLSLPESHQCRGSKSLQFYGTVQTNSLGQNSILCTEKKKFIRVYDTLDNQDNRGKYQEKTSILLLSIT